MERPCPAHTADAAAEDCAELAEAADRKARRLAAKAGSSLGSWASSSSS